MRKRITTFGVVLFAWLAFLCSAAALQAAPPDSLDLRYDLYWGGIRIADLTLRHDADPLSYGSELSIKTVSVAELLARYRGHARISGERQPPGQLVPVAYRSEHESRESTRVSIVNFDPETGRVTELDLKKRGRAKESKVPGTLQVDVIDPLTAFFRLRERVDAARSGGSKHFQAAVFDGPRRYDVRAELVGRTRIQLAGREWQALRLELRMLPLAGFDEDDLAESETGDEGLLIEVLLSDDEHLLPLKMRTLNMAINAAIWLRQDCSTPGGCLPAAS